jgi:predicted ATPase/class 3 adenylate cyclase
MSDPPSGTVTFLFTDIEGSTKRWEEHPQAMRSALARHDDMLRQAIESHEGYVFKTMGDAFCATFSNPYDALFAAIDAQRALHNEAWSDTGGGGGGGGGSGNGGWNGSGQIEEIRVRMALHTGVTEEQRTKDGDSDYFGQPVNRVARLLAAAHGGQVLLSEVTYGLVRDNLPQQATASDMGEHRLKDLYRPEHIFQLIIPDLPEGFPPLRTLDSRPNNLPFQPTSLIGREKEVEEIDQRLLKHDVRLLTLTGPGGTGKTRLALQAAAELVDHFEDGVYFVDLAPLTYSSLVVSAIAQALGVRETGERPLIDSLKDYLKNRQTCLLLDNYEHLIEAGGVVGQLLQAAPGLKVLATSRVPLHIRGEKEYAVQPLQLPDTRHLPPLEQLTQYEAVRLFIERGTDVKSDFAVDNDNAPAVAEICVRLDGLPLAIELAAGRVKFLSPQAILSRLQSRLKLLMGGARDAPSRQLTLRNTIAWSYDLLSEDEQTLFRRLAVFQGVRTIEAIEAVCNTGGDLDIDTLEGVLSLADKSLLRQEEGISGEPRFAMLETIHEFAREKLQESGEEEVLSREHALCFMRLAEEAEPFLTGPKQAEWLNMLAGEHDNLRCALKWVGGEAENGDLEVAEIGLRIAGALWQFWSMRGYLSEGREELEAVLSWTGRPGGTHGGRSEALRGARAKVLYGAGRLAFRQGDFVAARSRLDESLTIYKVSGDKRGIAYSLSYMVSYFDILLTDLQGGEAEARLLGEEALRIFRDLGDKRGTAQALESLGWLASKREDFTNARTLHEESLAIFRQLGDKQGISSALTGLGCLASEHGNYAEARSLFEESLSIDRQLGDKFSIARTLGNLGEVAMLEGKYASARALAEEGLSIYRALGSAAQIIWLLGNLGNLAILERNYAAGGLVYKEHLEMIQKVGLKRGVIQGLIGLGGAAAGMGQPEKGAKLVGAAESLLDAAGRKLGPDEHLVYDPSIASIRAQLGEETFERARHEGRVMSVEQAIVYALEETADD